MFESLKAALDGVQSAFSGHQHLDIWSFGPCCAAAHVHQLSLISFTFGLFFIRLTKCRPDSDSARMASSLGRMSAVKRS